MYSSKKEAVNFAELVTKLCLNNGGKLPELDKLYDDWKAGTLSKFEPTKVSKVYEDKGCIHKESKGTETFCIYVHKRKQVKGTKCGVSTKHGNSYCPKHLAYIKILQKKGEC